MIDSTVCFANTGLVIGIALNDVEKRAAEERNTLEDMTWGSYKKPRQLTSQSLLLCLREHIPPSHPDIAGAVSFPNNDALCYPTGQFRVGSGAWESAITKGTLFKPQFYLKYFGNPINWYSPLFGTAFETGSNSIKTFFVQDTLTRHVHTRSCIVLTRTSLHGTSNSITGTSLDNQSKDALPRPKSLTPVVLIVAISVSTFVSLHNHIPFTGALDISRD